MVVRRLRIALSSFAGVISASLLLTCDVEAAFFLATPPFITRGFSSPSSSVSSSTAPFDCAEWQAWDAAFIQQQQAAVPDVEIVDKMPDPLSSKELHNHYYLLRHGQSTANLAEIISSDRATLAYSTKHGLTAMGYQQGKAAAVPLLEAIAANKKAAASGDNDNNNNKTKVVFVSSPFARARQTAQACLDGLLLLRDEGSASSTRFKELMDDSLEIDETIVLHNGLVERSFGRLDNEKIYTYAYVWPLDKFNVTHTAFDVESVAAVCTRLRALVTELETTYNQHHIVLVSHADVLQIAQLYAAEVPNVGYFSSYRFASKYDVLGYSTLQYSTGLS